MKSKQLQSMEQHWVGSMVTCYIRNMNNKLKGPYEGTVKGLSTTESENGTGVSASGLLVEIPTLGRNLTCGEWPVMFCDVTSTRDSRK